MYILVLSLQSMYMTLPTYLSKLHTKSSVTFTYLKFFRSNLDSYYIAGINNL